LGSVKKWFYAIYCTICYKVKKYEQTNHFKINVSGSSSNGNVVNIQRCHILMELSLVQIPALHIELNKFQYWAEIHLALLSYFSHLAEFFIEKVSVKDLDSRVLTLVNLNPGSLDDGNLQLRTHKGRIFIWGWFLRLICIMHNRIDVSTSKIH
jgi:hypothetical protein